ncbi:MAG: hypothetical protein ACLTGJ_06490 [Faecalibacterium prausnitzii]
MRRLLCAVHGSYPPLRVGMLVAGMCLCLYYLMAAVNADYEGAALMLLPGAVTTGFRVWALMPGLDSVLFVGVFVPSLPALRRARPLRPPPLCHRLHGVRLPEVCSPLRPAPSSRPGSFWTPGRQERTKELTAETEARKSMMLNIFHDLRSPLFAVSIRAASKDAWRITIRQ